MIGVESANIGFEDGGVLVRLDAIHALLSLPHSEIVIGLDIPAQNDH